jgi:hypothetical protein
VITDLHFSTADVATVERLKVDKVFTKRRDKIREVLHGLPLCCICHSNVPTKKVTYDLEGVVRIETYCEEHFPLYEKTKDVSNTAIANSFGIIIGDPNK